MKTHQVADVMTTHVISVRERTPFKEIAELLGQAEVNAVPVVTDRGHVVGVVSRRDCIGVYTRPDDELRHDILHGLIDQELVMDPNRFAIAVEDGRVVIQGRTERRSQIRTLVQALRRVEGVVSVTAQLGFEVDDNLSEAYSGPVF